MTFEPYTTLEKGVYAALETYSNVHRGSGHKSMLTTKIFEKSRQIVLEHLGLDSRRYMVIFASPDGSDRLADKLERDHYKRLSSKELGLSLGVVAMAVKKKSLPRGAPVRCGGGTARLISQEWVIWAKGPAKYEAGTPAIINIITFARALLMMAKYGEGTFGQPDTAAGNTGKLIDTGGFGDDLGKKLLERLRESRIGFNLEVPGIQGAVRAINLDSSASTPTFQPIWDAFRWGLSLSQELHGEVIDQVKKLCLDHLGASGDHYDVVFTSNTTEAINIVGESLNRLSGDENEPVIVSSLLEHSSNDLPWRNIRGSSIIRLSFDDRGFFEPDELRQYLREYNQDKIHGRRRIGMVALSGASNVLGTCNGMAPISKIVHQYGALLLVDGAQLVAHRSTHMERNGIDFLAFSAHKIYAPFGSGALVYRKGALDVTSLELKRINASGNENMAGIAALGKSLHILGRIGMQLIENEEITLTENAMEQLTAVKGLTLYGIRDRNSPGFERRLGVFAFNLKKLLSFRVGNELAYRHGIGVRVGCHCAHITVKHILKVSRGLERFQRVIQMLVPTMQFPGVVRVSLGLENKEEDIDLLIRGLNEMNENVKKSIPSSSFIKSGTMEAFYRSRMHLVFGEY